jgi:Lrp/AsnC family leucine-responsive transcriptional regulator
LISLDDLDYRIIRLLQLDARMSSREMTSRLGDISDRVVRYRIDRLIKNGVILVQAIVNPSAVGFPFVGDVLVDVVPWKLAEVATKLAAMAPVCYVSSAYSGNQLSIEVNARTEYELMTFVHRVVNHIEGVVNTHTMIVPHLIKDVALWEIPR